MVQPSPSSIPSNHGSNASSANDTSAPLISMLIDRTSFDETDDFNVDPMIQKKADECVVSSPPVIMKDGKVRRRLRWRPKNMMKERNKGSNRNLRSMPPPSPSSSFVKQQQVNSNSSTIPIPFDLKQHQQQRQHASSSNASVISQTSKQSKKSYHSFASTETACVNNTSKLNNNKGGGASKRYSLTSPQQQGTTPTSTTATIGNEGDLIYAKMHQQYQEQYRTASNTAKNSTIFTAADDNNSVLGVRLSAPQQQQRTNTNATATTAKLALSKKPPLFQQKRQSQVAVGGSPRNSNSSYQNKNSMNTSMTSSTTSATSDTTDESSDDEHFTIHSNAVSISRSSSGSKNAIPVPVLSGDEVENDDRRVDLRIRKVSSNGNTMSMNTTVGASAGNLSHSQHGNEIVMTAMLENGVEPLSVHELQSASTLGSWTSSLMTWSTAQDRMQSATNPPAEMRFKMATKQESVTGNSFSSVNRVHNGSTSTTTIVVTPTGDGEITSSIAKPKVTRTCPVDVDKGTFLEAEKNLQAIHEMASEHLRQGEFTEALEVFEEILRGQLARFGEDHYRVGTALHNIGIVHMRRKDYARALTVYKEAVRIRKKTHDPFHPDIAASLAQLGVAYMERGKYRKAIGAFREALRIRRMCLGNDHPKVAKILNNIGCSLFELNELEVAMVAFEEALDIQRNLLREPKDSSPVSESSLLSIASTQSNIASIKLYYGHFDEALVDLEEALLIQQCALGDDHPLARRTQESIKWMEATRQQQQPEANNESGPISVDLFTQLTSDDSIASTTVDTITTSTMNCNISKSNSAGNCKKRSESSNMFDALLARLDLACGGGWTTEDEIDDDDDDDGSSYTGGGGTTVFSSSTRSSTE